MLLPCASPAVPGRRISTDASVTMLRLVQSPSTPSAQLVTLMLAQMRITPRMTYSHPGSVKLMPMSASVTVLPLYRQ